jgi:acyl dehydratase
MAVHKVVRGHFFEDFEIGHTFKHHWGRTINEGDNSLFSTVTLNYWPAALNREYAQSLGYAGCVVHPILVMNVVFGLSVEDLSEQAIAHLGYFKMKYGVPVYPGDTLTSESTVLEKRESESRPGFGIVRFKTTGRNQKGEIVLEYERPVLIKKRSHYGPPEVPRPEAPSAARADSKSAGADSKNAVAAKGGKS